MKVILPRQVFTVNEDGNIRKGVIKLVKITEVHHRFSTFVHRRMKGRCWIVRDEGNYAQVGNFYLRSP